MHQTALSRPGAGSGAAALPASPSLPSLFPLQLLSAARLPQVALRTTERGWMWLWEGQPLQHICSELPLGLMFGCRPRASLHLNPMAAAESRAWQPASQQGAEAPRRPGMRMGRGCHPGWSRWELPPHAALRPTARRCWTLLYSRCAIAGNLADRDGREGQSGAEGPQVPLGFSRLLLRILSAHREAQPAPLAASVPDGDTGSQPDGAQ